jgi:uncharacterized membrane protein YgaE (UPF0421/DUF939 family)
VSRGLGPAVVAALTDARAVHALKVAVAAALAWVLIAPFGGVADEYAYYAPLGAVASVAGTVASSLRATLSSIAAIALGAVPAIAVLALSRPGVLSLALVVLVGAWVAGSARLGASASWVPISGLFILIIGAPDPWRYAGAYLGLVAFGALVGLAVNTVWPALPLRSTQRALDLLRETLALQLHDLADGVRAQPLPDGAAWAERRRDIDVHADQMDAMLAEVREAQRINWRASRWRRTAEDQYQQARALKGLSFLVEDIYDLVAGNERSDLGDVALGPALRPAAARAFEATADALAVAGGVDDDGRWETARGMTEGLADLIITMRNGTPHEFFAAGALVNALRRALDSLDPGATAAR